MGYRGNARERELPKCFFPVLLRLGGRQERVAAVAANETVFSRLMLSCWRLTFVRSRVRRDSWCCWCKLSFSRQLHYEARRNLCDNNLRQPTAFLCIPHGWTACSRC